MKEKEPSDLFVILGYCIIFIVFIFLYIGIIIGIKCCDNKNNKIRNAFVSETKKVKLYNIDLKSKRESSGFFVIAFGGYSSEEIEYYYFYADGNKGVKLYKVNRENVYFKFNDNVEPYCEYYTKYDGMHGYGVRTFEDAINRKQQILLVIPKDSLKRKYNINIK